MKTNYVLSMNRQTRILLMSLIPAIAALLVSILFQSFSLSIFAIVAAAVTGALCWWFVIERPAKFTQKRFILAGLLCGIISHPILWLLYMAVPVLSEASLQSFDLFGVMVDILSIIGVSLLIVGWATSAVGAIGGWLFWKCWNRHTVSG